MLRQVLDAAGLELPGAEALPGQGREGDHTEHLAPLLAELQSVARALVVAAQRRPQDLDDAAYFVSNVVPALLLAGVLL